MNQSKLADSIGVTRQAVSAYSLPDIEIENDFKFTLKEPEPLTEVFSEWLTR